MFERFDTYGSGLNILFNGSDVFKTKLGGFIKVIVNILVFTYAIGKIQQLWLREDPLIQTISKLVKLNETEHLNLADNDFDLVAMIMENDFAAGSTRIVKVPRNVGEIRMVMLKVDQP